MVRLSHSAIYAALISVALLGLSFSYAFAPEATANRQYTGPNHMFTVNIPSSQNFAGVPYTITALDTKGDKQYDKALFHVDDFGEYLVAGVRAMPSPAVSEMDQDEPRTVLRNLSQATLMGWRTDLSALPDVARESFLDTKYGEAIVRVYRVKKGSILTRAQGRRPTGDDVFDTNIASVVARQGPIVVFVLAQDDANPDEESRVVRKATELFNELRVLANR
jgi:hypothetical protein